MNYVFEQQLRPVS